MKSISYAVSSSTARVQIGDREYVATFEDNIHHLEYFSQKIRSLNTYIDRFEASLSTLAKFEINSTFKPASKRMRVASESTLNSILFKSFKEDTWHFHACSPDFAMADTFLEELLTGPEAVYKAVIVDPRGQVVKTAKLIN